MTEPRQLLAGSSYLITRRTLMRQFTLRPDPRVEQLWLYSLAFYAQKHGIEVHSFTLMSSHEHLVSTDTLGKLHLFLRDFHRTVAKGLKALLKLESNLWEDTPCSVVQLRTLEAFVKESAYVIANPVEAEAVAHSSQWPGLLISASEVGHKTITVKRPAVYFSRRNKQWPDELTLTLTLPQLGDYSAAEVRELIGNEAERLESEARRRVRVQGRTFRGAKKVKQVSRLMRATQAPKRGDRNPTFAVGPNNPEAYATAVLAVREFRRLYREALKAWRDGDRQVVFPAGTVVMRWLHNAKVAAAA